MANVGHGASGTVVGERNSADMIAGAAPKSAATGAGSAHGDHGDQGGGNGGAPPDRGEGGVPPAPPERGEMKWYIVHTYSGHENKAKLTLLERVRNANLTEYFGEVLVPTESVMEVVKGQRRTT